MHLPLPHLLLASGLASVAMMAQAQPSLKITPSAVNARPGQTLVFRAALSGARPRRMTWSATEGLVRPLGSFLAFYTAPRTPGVYTLTVAYSRTLKATATITVGTPTPVGVTVSPASATILSGTTQAFSASVTGTTNTGVAWSVQESDGGTITPQGLYTAPTVLTPTTFHVVAASQADPAQRATATVQVMPKVAIAVAPTTATVRSESTFAFTADVTGASNTAVAWSVQEPNGGTISSNGFYAAPATLVPATYHVMATAQADPTKTAVATVSVMPKVQVAVQPATATILPGASLQLAAQVAFASDPSVTWSVTGSGDVSATGLYTAAADLAQEEKVTVTATSVEDPTVKASAVLTVTPVQQRKWQTPVVIGGNVDGAFHPTVSTRSDGTAIAAWIENIPITGHLHPTAVQVWVALRPAGGSWSTPRLLFPLSRVYSGGIPGNGVPTNDANTPVIKFGSENRAYISCVTSDSADGGAAWNFGSVDLGTGAISVLVQSETDRVNQFTPEGNFYLDPQGLPLATSDCPAFRYNTNIFSNDKDYMRFIDPGDAAQGVPSSVLAREGQAWSSVPEPERSLVLNMPEHAVDSQGNMAGIVSDPVTYMKTLYHRPVGGSWTRFGDVPITPTGYVPNGVLSLAGNSGVLRFEDTVNTPTGPESRQYLLPFGPAGFGTYTTPPANGLSYAIQACTANNGNGELLFTSDGLAQTFEAALYHPSQGWTALPLPFAIQGVVIPAPTPTGFTVVYTDGTTIYSVDYK